MLARYARNDIKRNSEEVSNGCFYKSKVMDINPVSYTHLVAVYVDKNWNLSKCGFMVEY